MDQERILAAIMFTDIVGYTSLMGSDESKAMEIVRHNKEVQKPLVEQYNGTWLKEMGDGTMASFKTASDAINCAVDIQKVLYNDPDLNLRIGIHLGEIILEEGDVYGDGVNIASRLQAIADPGGVYISDSVQKAIRGNNDIKSVLLGELELKNVDYPVKTYALSSEFLPQPKKTEEKHLSGRLIAEMQRRNVVRAGVAYLALGIILYFLIQFLPFSSIVENVIYGLLLLGLPLSIYGAWNYELSPDGLVRISSRKAWENPYSERQKKPLTGNVVIIALLVIIAGFVAYPQLIGSNLESSAAEISTDKSIAVLPFDNLSNDPEQQYFADGMAEMIRTRLSKLGELKVTSMRSVVQYRDSEKTAPQIGDELNVAYILEGSVFKSGEQVRVNAQLIHANSDEHIWADFFEGNLSQLFKFQTDIATEVAEALRVELIGTTEPEIINSLVQDLVLAGNYNIGKLGEMNNSEYISIAEKLYRNALDVEPDNELALVGMGWVNFHRTGYGMGKYWLDSARVYGDKVLAINPDNSDVHYLLGRIFKDQDQSEISEQYFRRSIELDPNNAEAMNWLAEVLHLKGEFEESLQFSMKGLQLDPNNPFRARRSFVTMGWNFMMVGLDDDAELLLRKQQAMYPDDAQSHLNLSWLYVKQGRMEKARFELSELRKKSDIGNVDNFNLLDGYAFCNFLAGDYEYARQIYERQYDKTRVEFEEVENFHHTWRHRYATILWQDGKRDSAMALFMEHIEILENYIKVNATNTHTYDLAGTYAFLGDRENAYKWLDQMPYNDVTTFLIQVDPMFDSLREEDRFKELMNTLDTQRGKMRVILENIIVSEEMKNVLR